jgi:hypothetical protein
LIPETVLRSTSVGDEIEPLVERTAEDGEELEPIGTADEAQVKIIKTSRISWS